MQLRIRLQEWSILTKLPWALPSSKLGLVLVSQKTLTDTFTDKVYFPKDLSFFNQQK